MFGLNRLLGVPVRAVWQAQTGDHAIALAWSPDGRALAVAGVAGGVRVLAAADGRGRHALRGHSFGATAVAWFSNSALVSAGQDGTVRVWDADTGEERHALTAPARWVQAVAVSACGAFLAAAAGKGVRVWDADGRTVQDHTDHPSTVADIAWEPNGTDLVAAAYGGLTRWSAARAEPLDRYSWKGSVVRVAWSPDGRVIATGNQDATAHCWVIDRGADLKMYGYRRKVTELSWNRAGRFLATNGGPRVTVWDCSGEGPENTRPAVLVAHDETGHVTAVAFQPGGPVLASGGSDGRAYLWLPGHTTAPLGECRFAAPVTRLAWSPDGTLLAAGTDVGAVAVVKIG